MDHRVPKWRTRVDVQMPGGQKGAFAIYLSELAHDHPGPERLSDVLHGKREFLAAHDLEHDVVVLLSRGNISVARVVTEIEFDPDEQHTLPEENEVRVLLRDGYEVKGLLTYIRPDGRARVIDY